MKSSADDVQFRWFSAATLILLGFAAYINSFSGGFVWDDASSILLHKHVQDPSKIGQLFREDLHAFGRGQGNFYRPMLAISFMADYSRAFDGRMEGGVPQPAVFPFHLTNTILHTGAALWLFVLLVRAGAPRFVCWAAPALWIAHPLHTEAVAYISGRGDSMAAFFMFAALWFGLWETSGRTRAVGVSLSAVFFLTAILSKESALVLPFLFVPLLLWMPQFDGTPACRSTRLGRLPALGAMTALLAVYAGLRATTLNFGSDSTVPEQSAVERLLQTGQALAVYIKLIFVPIGLHMERTLDGIPAWAAFAGFAVLLGILAVVVFAVRKGQPRIAMAGAWFLITWFPISGLIALNAPLAEHWLYVPLAGILWMLLEFVWLACGRRPVPWPAIFAVCVCCLLLTALTVHRNRDWRSNEALYLATLKENPRSIRVQYNLAVTYQDLLNNPAGARRHFERVVALYREKKTSEGLSQSLFWDDELEAHLSLGDILSPVEPGKAMEHYAQVLSVSPDNGREGLVGMAAFGMGRCSLQLGQFEQAARFLKKAAELLPELKGQIAEMMPGSA
ncbi:MAG TPA: tetratricopeptide repeat protein [Candidatus Hydrogenedentes bacterium]|jgi:hypothetical protein|nr:tetratricopeptide repeat protein [Candidatus Hydrogenedentota bacterium]HPJ99603.1 tetratricopeptide repeat protein [Candidatus Hydrogenedentota bacterium]